MVLELCLCSISLIDEIIWLEICVVIFDPMIITILDLALCCVVSGSFIFDSLWQMAAKRLYSVVVLTFSRPWFGTNPLIGKLTCVYTLPGLLLMYSWCLSIMINMSGWVWILVVTSDVSELLQFAQSLSSNCSIPKSRWINSFKDICDLSWGKLNIISVKSAFAWEICWQRLHL